MGEQRLIDKAVIFATEHHAGQTRKGKDTPYIVHPLETMLILRDMGADETLMAAGVLHDTVEDTDATAADIETLFGPEVTRLVTAHSEDKTKTWKERKAHTIESLKTAERAVQMLVLADKVSNLRDMCRDYQAVGERLWERFNAPKEQQAWYYGGIQDSLEDMEFDPDCSAYYWEMVGLFKDLFVRFYLDEERESLYQIGANGEGYTLQRSRLDWQSFIGELPEGAEEIPRLQAESIENVWHDLSLWEDEGGRSGRMS